MKAYEIRCADTWVDGLLQLASEALVGLENVIQLIPNILDPRSLQLIDTELGSHLEARLQRRVLDESLPVCRLKENYSSNK